MLTFDIKIYDLADTFPQWIGRMTLISSDVGRLDAIYNYGVVPNLDVIVFALSQFISVK